MTATETSEPTMEEILASIRKIISDEQIAPAQQVRPALAVPPSEPAAAVLTPQFRPSTEVLELTDSVEAAPSLELPEKLMSDAVEEAATAQLSTLSGMMLRNYPGAENTLEGVVRDMLRPMLKSWLDQNLPDMVESIVAREIARISGRAR